MGSPDAVLTGRRDVERRPPAPYARVKQHLKEGLAAGRWPPGALMPSEAELVAEFGVSRMTVNRALRELQSEGLVERSQGVGTFAAPAAPRVVDADDPRPARGDRSRAATATTPACTCSARSARRAALAAATGPGAPARACSTR